MRCCVAEWWGSGYTVRATCRVVVAAPGPTRQTASYVRRRPLTDASFARHRLSLRFGACQRDAAAATAGTAAAAAVGTTTAAAAAAGTASGTVADIATIAFLLDTADVQCHPCGGAGARRRCLFDTLDLELVRRVHLRGRGGK